MWSLTFQSLQLRLSLSLRLRLSPSLRLRQVQVYNCGKSKSPIAASPSLRLRQVQVYDCGKSKSTIVASPSLRLRQHGPPECLLNTIEACAIEAWPDLNKHFSFIYCVETLVYERKYPEWETCFDKLGLDPTPITECYSSRYGNELELQYAAETNALQPPHEYVPWVAVDGQPLYEDYENFISYICKAYKGTTMPNACSDLALKTIPKEKAYSSHPVCYREEATKSTLSKIRSAIISWMEQVYDAVSW
ncbi:Gamma-interferon-inducible lysosomal thiol reductase [Actinidia chinensis var. chinensis]|uniref:Gamma-interferon-inducible lysosomal thiol reductase n=1 Tax=Actinidia chinensis var. chinensis TaxID=1590841 RepID=A0A2R6P6G9_ACTCC|nr:Gamma-interferon-inducible lysosomal thiol reductase [Actinidia chinensis var. chinensis]